MENMGIDNFYQSKKVLITGHTGFKGGWLALWLNMLGAEVIGYAQEPPTSPSFFKVCHISDKVTSIIGDVRDKPFLESVFKKYHPEIIFHMAAQPLVRKSYKEPVETFETNVMGTVNVLECCRQTSSVKVIINITTDKCYENRESLEGYSEGDALGGCDPYSASKAASEMVTNTYRQSFFNPKDFQNHGVALASVRAGNVIGGGDWAEDRIIPDCIKAFINHKEVVVRSPQAVRPWQHVIELLYGYLLLGEKLYTNGAAFSEAWNFGPEDKNLKSVQWILERMVKLWGEGASWKIDNNQQPHETDYLKLKNDKAKARLGWNPQWDMDIVLEKTVAWYQAFENGEDMEKFSMEQIEGYERIR